MKNWLWFALSLAACAVNWTYTHRVLLPWEQYANTRPHGRFRAILDDIYPRWVGTRELLLHGKNPYSAEVSHEIQMGFYGHPIEQTYDKPMFEIIDEQRFAYPIYVTFLLAPTVHAEFQDLRAWALMALVTLTATGAWLWMSVLRWRPPRLLGMALALFMLASPQITQGLKLRQLGLLVAFLLALGCWCITRESYYVAGAVLALATIKPHMVLLLLTWLALWTLGDWRKRWPLAAGFCGTLALLIGAGVLLVPSWPLDFLKGVVAYSKYFPTTSLVRLILGNWIGGAVSLLVVMALLWAAWRNRKAASDSPEFVRMLVLFLLATSLVLPLMVPSNQVLLFLPFLALTRDWNSLLPFWRRSLAVVITWPWVVALLFLTHPPNIDSMDRWPLLPSALTMLVPFLVLILHFVSRKRPLAIAQ